MTAPKKFTVDPFAALLNDAPMVEPQAEASLGKQLFGNAIHQKGNKFKVAPVEARTSSDGLVFDSKLEKKFHEVIIKHLPDSEVTRQVTFLLQPSFRGTHDGKIVRGIHYRADFVFGPIGGTADDPVPLPGCVIVDAKGMETPVFKLASKMFTHRFRHQVRALKSQKQLLVAIDQYTKFKEMNQTIKDRADDKLPFTITGYKGSDGSVKNLTVRFLGPDGYFNLAKESLVALDSAAKATWKNEVLTADRNVAPEFLEATEQARASLIKTTSERDTTENAPAKVSSETLEPVSDNLCLLNGHPTHIVAFRLEVLNTVVIKSPDKPAAKSKDPVKAYKKLIADALPVARYCHRLNLYPDKYDGIE